MENKTNVRKNESKTAEPKKKKLKEINVLGIIIPVITLAALLLFFLNWGLVHNVGMNDGAGGTEVEFSGISALIALITNNFEGTAPILKNIAVPFYYYAKEFVVIISALTAVAFVILLAALIFQLADVFADKTALRAVSSVAMFIAGLVLAGCFIVALLMSQSDILPVYCQGNPDCSIQSYAVFPAIVAIIGAVVNLVYTVKKM